MSVPGLSAPAQIRDLSSSGVSCTTDRPLAVLSQVHLQLLLPAYPTGAASGAAAASDGRPREVACRGAVVRCVRDGGRGAGPGDAFETAIFFTDMRETDRAAIEEFVMALRRRGQVA